MIKILFFADPIGTMDRTLEEEAAYCEKTLKTHGIESDFNMTCNSMDIVNGMYDILIFDYGGILPGASGLIASLSRGIIKVIEEFPNKLFVAWTVMTHDFLEEECEKEIGEYPNFIVKTSDAFVFEKMRKWIIEGKEE